MENYIICPCCGNKMRVLCEDGKLTVFFVAENQDDLLEVLQSKNIELAISNGGDDCG